MGSILGRLFDTGPNSIRWRSYFVAVTAGLLALAMRGVLDRFLQDDHAFVVSLFAVAYVAWQCGFAPAIVTLVLSLSGAVYFFVAPRHTFLVERASDQVTITAFFFCGTAMAALGLAQWTARQRATEALADSEARRSELEAEMSRRTTAENELRASEERFRSLAEHVPQIVWMTDAAGQPTFFNPQWYEYTGRPPGEFRAGIVTEFIHPAEREQVLALWDAARHENRDRLSQEFRFRRRDGEYRWQKSEAVAQRDEAGRVVQWVGTLTDIDDQKRQAENLERLVRERTADLRFQVEERMRVEEQVRATARELRRSNSDLEQFAYIASHDLQEPLRKVQAFGDLLRSKYTAQLPENGREYVQKMQASANRMSRLIEDLLTYSRVTTQARSFARLDLSAILANVLEDLETRVERTGSTIEASSLPTIDADPTQMRQLLQNLLGNAIKFARPNVPLVIHVRGEIVTEPDPGNRLREILRLEIEDNGIGFEEKYVNRIFQMFQRLHGRGEYEGTGIGLAICQKIVNRHGGSITATSRLNEGSTFTVVLPVHQASPAVSPIDSGEIVEAIEESSGRTS